jgi:branched-chain amino acid transport system ATP-binding protein
VLQLEGVDAGYGQGQVLFDISLQVNRGEVVCLLGRNGAGKSTTLKSIMGLVPPARGRITYLGHDLVGLPTYKVSRLGIGYVPEDRRIFPALSVRENLEAARHQSTDGSAWTLERVFVLFPHLRVLENRSGGHLSGGEQQMLTIARTLMGNPRLLLLDEPSEGLAPLVVAALAEQINQLKEQGLTILLSEQNMHFATALSDRVYVIDKGVIYFSGTFQELEAKPEAKKAHLMV